MEILIIAFILIVGVVVYLIVKSSKEASNAEKRVVKQYGPEDINGAKAYIAEIRKERESKEVSMRPMISRDEKFAEHNGEKEMDREIAQIIVQSMMNEDAPPRQEHHHQNIDHSSSQDHSVHHHFSHDHTPSHDHSSSFDHGSHSSDSSSYSTSND